MLTLWNRIFHMHTRYFTVSGNSCFYRKTLIIKAYWKSQYNLNIYYALKKKLYQELLLKTIILDIVRKRGFLKFFNVYCIIILLYNCEDYGKIIKFLKYYYFLIFLCKFNNIQKYCLVFPSFLPTYNLNIGFRSRINN